MRIGVIGSGKVGAKIATRWSRVGHKVMTGVRRPTETVPVDGSSPVSIATAVSHSELIVLAIPCVALQEVLPHLRDSTATIVDCINPVSFDGNRARRLDLAAASVAELIAFECPSARVVKALNTQHADLLLKDTNSSVQYDGFFCGEDTAANAQVEQLLRELRLRPVYCGGLENAGLLEQLALLGIRLALEAYPDHDLSFSVAITPRDDRSRA